MSMTVLQMFDKDARTLLGDTVYNMIGGLDEIIHRAEAEKVIEVGSTQDGLDPDQFESLTNWIVTTLQ